MGSLEEHSDEEPRFDPDDQRLWTPANVPMLTLLRDNAAQTQWDAETVEQLLMTFPWVLYNTDFMPSKGKNPVPDRQNFEQIAQEIIDFASKGGDDGFQNAASAIAEKFDALKQAGIFRQGFLVEGSNDVVKMACRAAARKLKLHAGRLRWDVEHRAASLAEVSIQLRLVPKQNGN